MSALAKIREKLRQTTTGDIEFLERYLCFFELRVPREVAAHGIVTEFLFPLVIPPESYDLDEPFSTEVTPTMEGGMIVDENGIVHRSIKIAGTTGWKPRTMKGSAWSLHSLTPDQRSWSRDLSTLVFDKISGHRHFQYLQDAIFRTYSDLKRDPVLAPDTKLIFHNPKDDEHWVVAVKHFSLKRSVSRKMLYQYSIELLCIEKAEAVDHDFSEDKSLLDQIKDAKAQINRAIDMVEGAIRDMTRLINEIRNIVKGFTELIFRVESVLSAAKDYIDGIEALIRVPLASVEELIRLVEAAGEALGRSEEGGGPAIPDKVLQDVAAIQDGLEIMATQKATFETSAQKQIADLAGTRGLRAATLSKEAPRDLSAAGVGTTPTEGETARSRAAITAGSELRQYTSTFSYTLARGDTLVSLASRYLGDGRRWRDIALFNGLKPPFTDDQAAANLAESDSPLPGVAGPGQTIRIPSFAKAPAQLPLVPVLGAATGAPMLEQLLGVDWALVPDERGFFDLQVDVPEGAKGAVVVRGIDNLIQAVHLRLATEYGSDPLYRAVGVRRVVALGSSAADLAAARFRIVEALTADTRIVKAIKILIDQSEASPDLVEVEATLQVRGYSQDIPVRVAV